MSVGLNRNREKEGLVVRTSQTNRVVWWCHGTVWKQRKTRDTESDLHSRGNPTGTMQAQTSGIRHKLIILTIHNIKSWCDKNRTSRGSMQIRRQVFLQSVHSGQNIVTTWDFTGQKKNPEQDCEQDSFPNNCYSRVTSSSCHQLEKKKRLRLVELSWNWHAHVLSQQLCLK